MQTHEVTPLSSHPIGALFAVDVGLKQPGKGDHRLAIPALVDMRVANKPVAEGKLFKLGAVAVDAPQIHVAITH